jgi:UDP-glucose 4-epimerase
MNDRAFVTGGAGCIGSDLVGRLLGRGDKVTVLDNLSSGKLEHIQPFLGRPDFRFVEGDLLDVDRMLQAVSGANIVYHLAANPDVKYVPGEPTDRDLKQNTIGTYQLLEAMRQRAVRRLVFASTSAVYGLSERQPIPEEQACRPVSLYGATKLACEAMIGAFQSLFAMDCLILRFANIIGPKVRKVGGTVIGDFIAKLHKDPSRLQILGNGKQAKSYLLSEECVDAMIFAVDRAPVGLRILNLGCDDNLSVRRIADMVVEGMELRDVQYEFTGGESGWPGDVPRFVLDVGAINQLGWRAKHTSEQAVALVIQASLVEPFEEPQCRP